MLTFSVSEGYTPSAALSTGRAPDRGEVAPRRAPPETFGELARRLDDAGERHTGLDPEPFQEIEEVLGGEIARRARSVGTAAESSRRRVERRHAALQAREHVGERRPPRVVEVEREHASRDAGLVEHLDDVVDVGRRRDA